MRVRPVAVVLSLAVVALWPTAALAHGPMGMAGLGKALILMIGLVVLFMSLSLGALAWVTALSPPKSSWLIFGRGFIGVAAVVTFLIGGMMVAAGLGKSLGSLGKYTEGVIFFVAEAFLAVEFFVAGTLYLRVYRERKSVMALLLCGASYALTGVMALLIAIGLLFALID